MVAAETIGHVLRRFQLVLIKPSHYDDDGYVVQWLRSSIPSNSSGSDVHPGGATPRSARCSAPTRRDRHHGARRDQHAGHVAGRSSSCWRNMNFGMVGLVGVQSNQFPRALDIARPLRAAGITVVIGGFHVSRLPGDAARRCSPTCRRRSTSASRCSPARPRAASRPCCATSPRERSKPIYNHLDDLPALEDTPTPFLPRAIDPARTIKHHASFDAGRGCPFQCSFCTIINVQGRKSRCRSPDDVERLIRAALGRGHTPLLHHRR